MPTANTSCSNYVLTRKINISLNVKQDTGLKLLPKGYNAYHSIKPIITDVDKYIESDIVAYNRLLRELALIFQPQLISNPTPARLLQWQWDDDIPAMDPREQTVTTNAMIAAAYRMVPDVNASKMNVDGGTSYRNILLCNEAYTAVGARTEAIAYNVPSMLGGTQYVQYNQSLSTGNYAIYAVTNQNIVVIAFRGTNSYTDVITDMVLTTGFTTDPRFVETRNIYNTIKNSSIYNGWAIEVTGHSLGGTLALYLNNLYGVKADVFDPAIGSTLFFNNVSKNNATAHIVKGDVVSPLVYVNKVVSKLFIYPVEDTTYGYYGYHLRSNFYILS